MADQHHLQIGNDIHVIHRREFADESARTGWGGAAAVDIDMVFLQRDTMAYYILESIAPLTWSPVSKGDMDKATYDTNDNGACDTADALTGIAGAAISTYYGKDETGAIGFHAVQTLTNANIKTMYEANPDTNPYTDDDAAKLGGIEENAKDDQNAGEVPIDAVGFDTNLDPSVDDVQKLAQAVDDLVLGGGGGSGDMEKATYDTNDDGSVDLADNIQSALTADPSQYYGKNSLGVLGLHDLPTAGAGGTLETRILTGMDQNDEVEVNHNPDSLGRNVTVSQFVAGLTNQTRTDMDFLLSEEADYIQEDALNGTDFIGTSVTLHDSGVPSVVATIWDVYGGSVSDGGHTLDMSAATIGQNCAHTENIIAEAGKKYFFESKGNAGFRDTCAGFTWNDARLGINIGRNTTTGVYLAAQNGNQGYCWRNNGQETVAVDLSSIQYDGTMICGLDIDNLRFTVWNSDGVELFSTTNLGVGSLVGASIRASWNSYAGGWDGSSNTVNLGDSPALNWTPESSGYEWLGVGIVNEYPVASPSVEYAVFSATDSHVNIVISNEGKTATGLTNTNQPMISSPNLPVPTEKRYFEMQTHADCHTMLVYLGNWVDYNVGLASQDGQLWEYVGGWSQTPATSIFNTTVANIGFAIDPDANQIDIYRDNTLVGTVNPNPAINTWSQFFVGGTALGGAAAGGLDMFTDPADLQYAPPVGFTGGILGDVPNGTWDSSKSTASAVLSDSDFVVTNAGTGNTLADISGLAADEFYFEIQLVSPDNNGHFGLCTDPAGDYDNPPPNRFTFCTDNGFIYEDGWNQIGDSGLGGSSNNDIIGFHIGSTNISIHVNGNSTPAWTGPHGLGSGELHPFCYLSTGTQAAKINVGTSGFAYATMDGQGLIAGVAKGYYVTTSNAKQLAMDTIANIVSLAINSNEPTDTLIRWLASFDGRTTWKRLSGGVTVPVSMVMDVDNIGVVDTERSQDAFVLKETDGSYTMWYTVRDGTNQNIARAKSVDGITWTDHAVVLSRGSEGTYDTSDTHVPCVHLEDDGSYTMWYNGKDGTNVRIFRATSADGITWANHAVVLDIGAEGTYDTSHALGPSVLRLPDDSYRMWYSGFDGSTWKILTATSADGITWANHVLAIDSNRLPAWDSNFVIYPKVLQLPDTSFRILYMGHNAITYGILESTSADGVTWAVPTAAMGRRFEGTYDYDEIRTGGFLLDNGIFRQWYAGLEGGLYRMLHTASPDGVTWGSWSPPALIEDHPSGLTDFTGAPATSVFAGGFTGYVPTGEDFIDIAFELSTTDSTVTPKVTDLVFTVNENGMYEQLDRSEVSVKEASPNTLRIKKLSAGTANIKLSIGT